METGDGAGAPGAMAADRAVTALRIAAESPLGKPPGTVRAYLAVAIVAAFLAGHVAGAVLLLRAGALEAGLGLLGALAVEAATVTGFYFGARQGGG